MVTEVFVIKMYTKFNRLVKGFAVSVALVFGLIFISGATANAQNGGYYGNSPYYQDERYNGRDRRGNQSTRFAYQRGYREGYQQGIQAARYGQYGGYNNGYGNYGNYDNGNRNGWGSSPAWRQAYQNGFNRGYRDGLNRNRGRRNSGYTIRLPF